MLYFTGTVPNIGMYVLLYRTLPRIDFCFLGHISQKCPKYQNDHECCPSPQELLFDLFLTPSTLNITQILCWSFTFLRLSTIASSLSAGLTTNCICDYIWSDIVFLVHAGVPSAPGKVIASRNTKTSAFVKWEASKHLNNLMGYYVDASVVGSKTWFPCNHRPYKHTR